DAEDLTGLRAGGDFEGFLAPGGVDGDFAAERHEGEADGLVHVQIEAFAAVALMGFHAEQDIEIAAFAARGAGFAFAEQAELGAVLDAAGNVDLEGGGFVDAALTVAVGAGVGDDSAAALALVAGGGEAEEALNDAQPAGAAAAGAGS